MDSPWQYLEEVSEDDQVFLQRLVYLALILAGVTFASQIQKPAPYGRHVAKDRNWGPPVNQRVAHILNDGLWGVLFFIFMYSGVYGCRPTDIHSVNYLFALAWLAHFFHRGFIHPLIMRYSSKSISLGIPLTGLTLAYFSYLHASFLAQVRYQQSYHSDVRFIAGVTLFVIGYFTNRYADWTLRNLRTKSGSTKYAIPTGTLFQAVSSPNYFGEMIEWLGWAITTWSPAGFAYFCFASATFIPRARHNHQWYIRKFKNYPKRRKALIPYLY